VSRVAPARSVSGIGTSSPGCAAARRAEKSPGPSRYPTSQQVSADAVAQARTTSTTVQPRVRSQRHAAQPISTPTTRPMAQNHASAAMNSVSPRSDIVAPPLLFNSYVGGSTTSHQTTPAAAPKHSDAAAKPPSRAASCHVRRARVGAASVTTPDTTDQAMP
jgi:hypothetical protein